MSECKLKVYGNMDNITMDAEEGTINALLCSVGKGCGFDACVKCKLNVQVNNTIATTWKHKVTDLYTGKGVENE